MGFPFSVTNEERHESAFPKINPGLELKDAPILKHYVGVNPNDLTRKTLEAALSNLATQKHYGGRKCSILDAFLYVSVLNFWHS